MLKNSFLALRHRGPIRQRLDARRQSGISFECLLPQKLDRFTFTNKMLIISKKVVLLGAQAALAIRGFVVLIFTFLTFQGPKNRK